MGCKEVVDKAERWLKQNTDRYRLPKFADVVKSSDFQDLISEAQFKKMVKSFINKGFEVFSNKNTLTWLGRGIQAWAEIHSHMQDLHWSVQTLLKNIN